MIDNTDTLILRALQQNARLTMKELATEVHLSTTPVFERLRKLERNGYIRKYIAVLDEQKLGLGFMVFCNVKLRRMNSAVAADFVERVRAFPHVTECYNVSGTYDYLLKVHARDMAAYQQFLMNDLGAIESVAHIESTFVMNQEKHEYGIQL